MKYNINKGNILSKFAPAALGAAGAGLAGYMYSDGLDPENVSELHKLAQTSSDNLEHSEDRLKDLQDASNRSLEKYQTLRNTENLSPEQISQVEQLGSVASNNANLLKTARTQMDDARLDNNLTQDKYNQSQLIHDDRVHNFATNSAIAGGALGIGSTVIGAVRNRKK